jgi:hypothetical protein
VEQRAGLVGHRLGDRRVGVPERDRREAGEEIEVLLALAVPQPRALAPHERDRLPAVGLHHVVVVELVQLVVPAHRFAPTIVPIPSRVKNSRSSA